MIKDERSEFISILDLRGRRVPLLIVAAEGYKIAERGLFGRRIPGVDATHISEFSLWPGFAEEIVSAIESRALWARYGL